MIELMLLIGGNGGDEREARRICSSSLRNLLWVESIESLESRDDGEEVEQEKRHEWAEGKPRAVYVIVLAQITLACHRGRLLFIVIA